MDIGCGWGELLLRVVQASPSVRGIGVDHDAKALEHGRDLARQRGLEDRVTLLAQDGAMYHAAPVQAAICIGASQVWGPPVEDRQPLDYARALTAIRSRVQRGAHLVFGEGIWSSAPTAAAAAPLSGRLDELVGLAELVEISIANGFALVAVHEANLDEWDEFDSGYSACSPPSCLRMRRTTPTLARSASGRRGNEAATSVVTAG